VNAPTALELLEADPTGEGYEIWIVAGRPNELDNSMEGFLILTTDRMPQPVCYIAGCGPVELLAARMTALGKRSPECALDLRGRPLPAFIFRKFLIPEKFVGTPGRETWPFIAAMFTPAPSGEVAIFAVLGASEFGSIRDRAAAKLGDPSKDQGSI
jgi:hypothetical protein